MKYPDIGIPFSAETILERDIATHMTPPEVANLQIALVVAILITLIYMSRDS